jgi:hypothetical protein
MIAWSYFAQGKLTPSTREYVSIMDGVSPKVRHVASIVSGDVQYSTGMPRQLSRSTAKRAATIEYR